MPEIKVGDKVWYVPCVQTHWLDRDARGDPVFHFVHAGDGPPVVRFQKRAAEGDPVPRGHFAVCHPESEHAAKADQLPLGRVERRDADGTLHTSKGHKLKPSRHVRAWEATVVRVNADGSCDLDIQHPNGYETHHKPDREAVRAHAAELTARLAQEEAYVAAGLPHGPLRYEIDGKPCDRADWRKHVTSQVRDADNLTAVPGIPHDPGHGFHTFHTIEEA